MARAKTAMKKILEILRLHKDQGLSQRKVARASGCSLGTVNKVLRGAARAGLEWPLEQELSEEELQQRVFGASLVTPGDSRRQDLRFEDVYRDMQKNKHLTTRLAWEEYRAVHENGYGYSQFCHLFREWRRQRKVTMAQEHKAGEAMFVKCAVPGYAL
ncbi:MAG: helix-turn-helix domain-containing protein [Bryobacterales bacterium]|nr:helix-turn-helix domain-containing protein [Bryobacterales bacterium]